eukprot:TRINITY_DN68478_c0_g1_i1.p2 TRINITY_DN68478_c0_g1~~TRINITY_DN68478_c0_g1_i1.p2  ORF type:complete len:214 (+),score=108.72 TRINITY_DN68478_c0_g1_i1:28-642(+)
MMKQSSSSSSALILAVAAVLLTATALPSASASMHPRHAQKAAMFSQSMAKVRNEISHERMQLSSLSAAEQVLFGVAEGILKHTVPHLYDCAHDVYYTYDDFRNFANSLKHKSIHDVRNALESLIDGLREFDSACHDCGLVEVSERVAKFVAKMDNVIGDIWEIGHIIIDGYDLYEDLVAVKRDFDEHRWFDCGENIARVIDIVI